MFRFNKAWYRSKDFNECDVEVVRFSEWVAQLIWLRMKENAMDLFETCYAYTYNQTRTVRVSLKHSEMSTWKSES